MQYNDLNDLGELIIFFAEMSIFVFLKELSTGKMQTTM